MNVSTSACILIAAVILPASVSNAADALKCPGSLSTSVNQGAYAGWRVYSNNPLRLTGADISYVDGGVEATLDPDRRLPLNDEKLSSAGIYNLRSAGRRHVLYLDCHYGEHAQLSRVIPKSMSECRVVHHGRFDDAQDFEFEVTCH